MIEFRTLADDEKITEPGFYRISLDRHHNQPCAGPSVTSGVLRAITLHGPSKVWATHKLNPDRFQSPEKPALRMGRAMAALVEGGRKGLESAFIILPPDPPKRPTAAQINAYEGGRSSPSSTAAVEWWAFREKEAADSGRDLLPFSEAELILAMGERLALNANAVTLLSGEPEITMAFKCPDTDLWCLARPDTVTLDGMCGDYKKVSTQGRPFTPWLCDRRIESHGYDMQMAFAAEALDRLDVGWPEAVGLIFQEDQPPYDVIVREVGDEALRIGAYRNRMARVRFRQCLDSGEWPGPGEEIGAFHMNDKLRERLLEEMNMSGEAP